MKRILIPIRLLSLCLYLSCESNMEISEKNLIGVWEEIDSNNAKPNEQIGILISEMESRLYEEDIIILKNNSELEYSICSDGCFIELKQNQDNEIKLKYTCLGGEFEHPIKLSSKTLIIGKRKFKKYSN